MKRCSKCGVEKESRDFYKDKKYKDGICSQCKKCKNKKQNDYRKTVIGKIEERIRAKKYVLKNPERKWASTSLSDHKKRFLIKISLNELTEYAKNIKNCEYCGIELDWSAYTKNGKAIHNSPTMERKENSKIISLENIAIVCHKCNCAKNSGTFDELLEYAERLLKFQGRL